jgi:hypothetical protein
VLHPSWGTKDSKVLAALMTCDDEFLCEHVYRRFGVEIDGEAAANLSILAHRQKLQDCWGDCTANMWIKNRLTMMGLFKAEGNQPADVVLPVTLHFFFITLRETPEMLDRLKVIPEAVKDSLARSRIGKTYQNIQPIDRVASRVTEQA